MNTGPATAGPSRRYESKPGDAYAEESGIQRVLAEGTSSEGIYTHTLEIWPGEVHGHDVDGKFYVEHVVTIDGHFYRIKLWPMEPHMSKLEVSNLDGEARPGTWITNGMLTALLEESLKAVIKELRRDGLNGAISGLV
jgi:hypothetical protein